MVNRDSTAYRLGRLIGRLGLISVGFLLGKNWGRRPFNDFPKKD
jgi:hypothetical protein